MQNGWGALATAAPHELHGNLGFTAISAAWIRQSQQTQHWQPRRLEFGNLNAVLTTQRLEIRQSPTRRTDNLNGSKWHWASTSTINLDA
jgi:hypothetical protein